MEKGRSNYTFNIICDINLINSLMQSYIKANNFRQEEKKGEQYYKAGDAMIGYRYFNYCINGNQLIISAWLKGAFGEIKVEQTGIASMNIQSMNFRNSLNTLFQEIEKLNTGGNTMNNENQNLNEQGNVNTTQSTQEQVQSYQQQSVQAQPINNQEIQNTQAEINAQQQINSQTQFAQSFQDEATKKQEKLCEIGFWLSIFGLIASFVGVSYGLIVYIMDFYFASQGLKTRKKGKAIATIILSILSILIIIMGLIAS